MTDKSAEPAAIVGDYANYRRLETRKVFQVFIEWPLEMEAEVLKMLGTPNVNRPTRCAVALLTDLVPREGKAAGDSISVVNGVHVCGDALSGAPADSARPSPAAPKPPRAPRKWEDMPMPEQVGVRCQDAMFWRYLHVNSANDATIHIRDRCLVISRKEILPGTAAGDTWLAIDRDYQAWQKASAMGVEI
jgi:hypothetical protein